MDELVGEIQRENVHILDPVRVAAVIDEIIGDGPDKLQVLSDFDHTLTKSFHLGQKCDTCYNIIDNSPRLPADYRAKAYEIRNHYRPIEFDPLLTREEKYPKMVEWWTKAHNLLISCYITQNDIQQMVGDSSARLRDGCDWLFQQLYEYDVPTMIFSAGIGDVIEEVLAQQSKHYENIKIVSNYMDFDTTGKLIGFKNNIIHTFNKNEHGIHDSDYFKRLKHRDNVILLGDSVGDLGMADGAAEHTKNILRIGFLNHTVEKSLELYKKSFDIVLVQDETWDIPIAIMKKIFNQASR